MNQVYFPHYKEIRDADGNAYILISHPTTQRAYKIKISEFNLAVASGLISTDANNGLSIGTDGLLFAEEIDTLYTANGTLTGDRVVTGGSNDLTYNALDNHTINALTTSTTNVKLTPVGANTRIAQALTSLELATFAGPSLNNKIALTEGGAGSGINISSVTDDVTFTVTSGNHINLQMPAGSDLQIAGSAGVSGEMLQSSGAGTPPVWKKVRYAHPMVVGDWGAGTTLTITAAMHGLGPSYHTVTVFDAAHNIVPIAAVLTAVNVDGTSGAVILTIVNNAAAFAGTVYITI